MAGLRSAVVRSTGFRVQSLWGLGYWGFRVCGFSAERLGVEGLGVGVQG